MKLNIQNTFTKIRNALNNREDELLLEVDKNFGEPYCDVKILEQCKKLPNKIKLSLEKSKNIEQNKNELASFIHECIDIENNIKDINKINESIDKCKNQGEIEINFIYEEEFNLLIDNIKKFEIIKYNKIDSLIINKDIKKQEAIVNWI